MDSFKEEQRRRPLAVRRVHYRLVPGLYLGDNLV